MIYWLLGALGLTGGGIGIAALLGGGPAMLLAAKWLWSWLSHATFLQVACLALGVALAIDHMALLTAHHGERAWHKQFDDEHKGRIDDRAAYVKAQADAAVANKAQVAKVEQRQQEINNAKVSYLTGRLQLISDELRKQNAAAESAPRSAPASPGVESACRVIDPAWMCLSPADRLLAAQNEERHDELIDLVLEQSAVDPNKP